MKQISTTVPVTLACTVGRVLTLSTGTAAYAHLRTPDGTARTLSIRALLTSEYIQFLVFYYSFLRIKCVQT